MKNTNVKVVDIPSRNDDFDQWLADFLDLRKEGPNERELVLGAATAILTNAATSTGRQMINQAYKLDSDGASEALRLMEQEVGRKVRRAMSEAGLPPPEEVFRFVAKQEPFDPARINFYAVRCFDRYPMDAAEFEVIFGRQPINDDLHRINCAEEGSIGHMMCGWCMQHEIARFECGCVDGAMMGAGRTR